MEIARDRVLTTTLATAFIVQSLHMLEHSVQMYQHVVLGLPTKLSNGLLFFLDLEWNHFLFNSLFLVFFIIVVFRLRRYIERGLLKGGLLYHLIIAGVCTQLFHVIEHSYRMYQFIMTGCTPCTGLLGQSLNMVHYHFVLNLIPYVPILTLAIRSGVLVRLGPTFTSQNHDKKLDRLLIEYPAVFLSGVLFYGLMTGYSIDVDILGVAVFAALAASTIISITEGNILRNLLDMLGVAILGALCANMSYWSVMAYILIALFSSRIVSKIGNARLNYLALTFTLLLILSSPSLATSRWASYNLYTFLTILLVLGIIWVALNGALDMVFIYIFSWILLFLPYGHSQFSATLSEALVMIPSLALKTMSNPLFSLTAFFVLACPGTFPVGKWRLHYSLLSALISRLTSLAAPIDVSVFAGISLVNVGYVAVEACKTIRKTS